MMEAAMLWNEPNNKSHWDPEVDPDWSKFGRMITLAGQAAHAANPDVLLAYSYPPDTFALTDTAKVIPVTYRGTLPDLFKEGKGAVVQGKLEADGTFRATEVLAKHDENYMPPEAAHAVEQAGKAAATVSQ